MMDVGQHPVALQRVAGERQAQAMAHDAMRAVATDQPFGLDFFLAPVGAAQQDRRTPASSL